MTEHILGFDCAVDHDNCGVALTRVSGGRLLVEAAMKCGARKRPAEVLAKWLVTLPDAVLAVDAPLGWPAPLSQNLAGHQAGDPLQAPPDHLFRRYTDRHIRERLGKQSLDVGADRIARTAHSALAVLAEVRALTGLALPLAWSLNDRARQTIIEVYPAATLIAHGLPDGKYKEPKQRDQREAIVVGLIGEGVILDNRDEVLRSADALDAVICSLAAWDFLRGRAEPPDDLALATREGWIWASGPAAG